MKRNRPERDGEISLDAANWLVKRDRGFTAEEQDAFSTWLVADSRHGDWLARHQQTWKSFNLLGDWRPAHSAEPNPDLLARPRRHLRWQAPALLAAACLAVTFLFLQRPATGTASPEIAATAPLVLSSLSGYAKHTLEDGTVLELKHGASVLVQYTAAQRRVRIVQGEAFFSVAKNPARPFVVQAGDITVRAVGTAFNVRLGTASVEVLVTEGKVQVAPSAPSAQPVAPVPLLVAGQFAVVPLGLTSTPAVTSFSQGDQSRLLAWQPHLLEFDSTPLHEVVATFNRCNHVQLRLADERLNGLPIVASIRSDNLDAFVRLLELTTAARAERHGDQEIVLFVPEASAIAPAGR